MKQTAGRKGITDMHTETVGSVLSLDIIKKLNVEQLRQLKEKAILSERAKQLVDAEIQKRLDPEDQDEVEM